MYVYMYISGFLLVLIFVCTEVTLHTAHVSLLANKKKAFW